MYLCWYSSFYNVAPPPSPNPAILLVEEYGALAAAIASALRKFAPRHRLTVADSASDAVAAAERMAPRLVIFDCDGADSRLVETVGSIRAANKAVSLIAITTGIEPRLLEELEVQSAIAFVDKPFDLGRFRSVVTRMLDQDVAPEPRLADLLTLVCLAGASASIEVKASARQTGEVHVRAGKIIHASTASLAGPQALQVLLCWPRSKLFQRIPENPPPVSIHEPWQPALLHALRYARETIVETGTPGPPSTVDVLPRPAPAPKRRKPPTGKKVAVVDDTDLLLLFVEDVLSEAEPDLQIATAATGETGVQLVETFKPDLVLLDYSLPDFNGDEVCRRLLADEATARIPVLMMSGHVPQMLETAAKSHNVVATLAKPFRSAELIAAVRAALTGGQVPDRPRGPIRTEAASDLTEQVEAAALAAVSKVVHAPSEVQQVALRPGPQEQPEPPLPVSVTQLEAAREIVLTEPAIAPGAGTGRTARSDIATPMTPVRSSLPGDRSEVVMSLSLEVTAMQLTSELRLGALRARPAAHTIVLRFASAVLRGAIPAESSFELGPVILDRDGRMAELRVVPVPRPVQLVPPRSHFEISNVSIVPTNSHNRMEILPAPAAPMTVQMLARFELSGVELSPNFQVAALALLGDHEAVRISLEQASAAREQHATDFQIASVELDAFSRIAGLHLTPRTPAGS